MDYSCRFYNGNSSSGQWVHFWEEKKKGRLFGLIWADNAVQGQEIISVINRRRNLDQISNAAVGLFISHGDYFEAMASQGVYLAVKRGHYFSFLDFSHHQVVRGRGQDGDWWAISNSRDFIKQLFISGATSDIFPPANIAAVLIEINRSRSITHPQYLVRAPVHEAVHRRRLWTIIFSLIGIIILLISLWTIYRHRQINKEMRHQNLITQLETKINQKETEAAQKLFQDLKEISHDQREVDLYFQKIKKLVNPLELFYDTHLINESSNYSQIVFNGSGLVMFDPINNRLDWLSLSQSKKELDQGDHLQGIKAIITDKNKIYALTASEIRLFDGTEWKKLAPLEKEALDFQIWNNSLYVLYPETIKKLNSLSSWLAAGQQLPVNPAAMAIDGKIWILTDSGELKPYFHGKQDKFNFSQNLVLTGAKSLLTSTMSDDLIFADQNHVYVVSKSGELKLVKAVEEIKIIDLTADFNSKNLYILASDQKIYIISLP
ncbi:MAG TPA: hypothetical protein P5299_01440 [Candidatus Woesebacteria bacterium]|nr:hypothetical protein [Candidatus Woesebacteria bacterium]